MRELIGAAWTQSPQKRLMDVCLASSLLPVGAPLVLGAAALIKTVDDCSPIYSSDRVGENETPFTMYKLRTMPHETEHVASVGIHDTRASKLGGVLRKLRLDEVPQVVNIYRDEMSVVGPRPIVPSEYEAIMDALSPAEQREWRQARSQCRPGILDIFGYRAYKSGGNIVTTERVAADIEYAHTASFNNDARLILGSFGLFSAAFRNTNNSRPAIHEYRRGATTLTVVAQAMHASPSPEEQRMWGVVFSAVRVLDNLVDEQGVTNLIDTANALFEGSPTAGVPSELSREFAQLMRSQSEARQIEIFAGITSISRFAAAKHAAQNPAELAQIALEEARFFAKFLELPLTVNAETQKQRARFNSWLSSVAQIGEALDAAIDLREDYNAGRVIVRPSLASSMRIMREGLMHRRGVVPPVNWQTTKMLASCITATIADRQ